MIDSRVNLLKSPFAIGTNGRKVMVVVLKHRTWILVQYEPANRLVKLHKIIHAVDTICEPMGSDNRRKTRRAEAICCIALPRYIFGIAIITLADNEANVR